ncbi:hypothetical protein AB0N24_26340 [Arthrobacter sp. NPDC093128]|uniref:hypothetical protein n=1 Tax=Arthrobacter sp. NPDC093128 TaxID=3154979 RepID=UPI00341E4C43
MVGEHFSAQARRVIAGVDEQGRSTIDVDEDTSIRLTTPAFTVCDIWQVTNLPVHTMNHDSTSGEVLLDPPPAGFVYRLTTFPPDSEWDPESQYRAALEAMGNADAASNDSDSGIAGLHQTETVDVITVLTGELYAVLETAETLLRPGGSFVQRGTKHTWSNRGTEPCTIVALQIGATHSAT